MIRISKEFKDRQLTDILVNILIDRRTDTSLQARAEVMAQINEAYDEYEKSGERMPVVDTTPFERPLTY